MRLTPDEIREWSYTSTPPGTVLRCRLDGAQLLAAQLGRRLPALRTLLEHQIDLIELSLAERLPTGMSVGAGEPISLDTTPGTEEEVTDEPADALPDASPLSQ